MKKDVLEKNHQDDQPLSPCGEGLWEKIHQEEEEMTLLEESFVPLPAETEETHQEGIHQEEAHQEEMEEIQETVIQTTQMQTNDMDERV
jgi:hypothetical protein